MRGEGNHKIPGSFAPENMEKAGAERVKYSLACQHEDAIPIKFVSYAQKCPTVLCTFAVALRKESVDRNDMAGYRMHRTYVALRKESVDRNTVCAAVGIKQIVALRKESVDRNKHPNVENLVTAGVALRKESVDRNFMVLILALNILASLSARRAWIEIHDTIKAQRQEQGRSPQGERG